MQLIRLVEKTIAFKYSENKMRCPTHLYIGNSNVSVASEIVANISQNLFSYLHCAPEVTGLPNVPVPTSFNLTKDFYSDSKSIVTFVLKKLKIKQNIDNFFTKQKFHDVPGDWFNGPF